ncbi:Sulfotransferase family protein [Balamuthia mandrillaris]
MESGGVFLRWPALWAFCAGFALSFLLASFLWSENNIEDAATSTSSAANPLLPSSSASASAPNQEAQEASITCSKRISIATDLRDYFDELRGVASVPYPGSLNNKNNNKEKKNAEGQKNPKVFGLGMPKTGTSSLAEALQMLGFDSHHTFHKPVELLLRKDKEDSIAPLSVDVVRRYDPFDAVSDNPIPWFFEELLLMYPEAKFILTTRNVTKWWASWKAHMQRHTDPTDVALRMRSLNFGWQQPNEYFCVKGFLRHNRLVQAIVPPKQLLVMDVTAGDGFSKLCPFLGVPGEKCPPDEEFPVANTKENPTGANGKHGGGRGRGSGRRPGHVVLPAKVPVHD